MSIVYNEPNLVLEKNAIALLQIMINDKFITLIADNHDHHMTKECAPDKKIETMADFCYKELQHNHNAYLFLEYYLNSNPEEILTPSVLRVYHTCIMSFPHRVRYADYRDQYETDQTIRKSFIDNQIKYLYSEERDFFSLFRAGVNIIRDYKLDILKQKINMIVFDRVSELTGQDLISWMQNPINEMLFNARSEILMYLETPIKGVIDLIIHRSTEVAVQQKIREYLRLIYQKVSDMELVKVITSPTLSSNQSIVIIGMDHAKFIKKMLVDMYPKRGTSCILTPWKVRYEEITKTVNDCLSLYKVVLSDPKLCEKN
tara:strand:- start:5215 stop:6162 length:948 start_codon:yes stop_codon:yes gene_type:complete